jgi:hypothetical protein
VLPNRYIHCDVEGRAFVRTCPQNTRWIQPLLSCISEEIISANAAETTTTPAPASFLRDILPTGQQPQQYGQQQQLDLPVQQQQDGYGETRMSDDSRLGRIEQQRPINTLQGQQTPFGQVRGVQQQQQVNRLQQQQPQQAAGARNFQDFERQQPVGRVQVQPQQQQQLGRSSAQVIQVPQLQTPIDLQVPVQQQQQKQRLVQAQPQQFRQQF